MPTTMDIRQWLNDLKLGQYADSFANNDIDFDVIRQLTEADLEKLGLSLGHRKRLLAAAAALKTFLLAETPAIEATEARGPERRQLTAMFCDLAGSTEMSAALDPEELRDIIGRYQRSCTDVINSFQGYVAKYMGDGILAYFGYPKAHEDDADRAVLAALGIVDAISAATSGGRKPLAVRIGIATGEVVVGDQIGTESARESAVIGETPNLAARLQQSAPPNGVMVADRTRRLIRHGFSWSEPQTLSLKGFDEAVNAWQALGTTGAARGLAATSATQTPLVGRQSELRLLQDRLQAAQAGEGQVIFLVGGAGMGKSRITAAMMDAAQADGTLSIRFACSPFNQTSELKPFAAWIDREAGIVPNDAPDENLKRLDTWLAGADIDPGADAGVFAALLSLPMIGRYQMSDVTSKALREKTLDLIEAAIVSAARGHPAMLVFEDAHWIDPTSAELLSRLIDRLSDLRFLVIVNARPEFEPTWVRLPHVTMLTVSRLPNRDATKLIEQNAAPHKLAANVVDQLLARAQGNALFLQELTRTVVDQLPHVGSQPEVRAEQTLHTIPATLRDLLMERLDRLGEAKSIAQAAAVIGEDFDKRLLAAIVDRPEGELQQYFDRLAEAQIIVSKAGAAGTGYAFRHALIQEAAYQSLLKEKRREYHRRIAESLERGAVPELGDREPERIAQHYAEAGIIDRAIGGWLRSGMHAAQRSANIEAVEQLNKALHLIRQQPAHTPQRAEKELSILIALGPSLMATRGWNAPEVRAVYDEAIRLGAETGRSLEMFPAVWGRWLTAHAGGDARGSRSLLEQMFDLIRNRKETDLVMQAHHAGCSTMMSDGEFEKCLRHMDASLAIYDIELHRLQAMRYGGHDPCVCIQCIGALAEMVMGHAGRSQQVSLAARSLADKIGHVPTSAHASYYGGELLQIVNEPVLAMQTANNVLQVGLEKGLGQYVAQAKMIRGWARTVAGDLDRGVGEMEEGHTELRAVRNFYHLPQRLGMRAQTYTLANRTEKALEAADDVIASVKQTGEVWYEAEALRIKAGALAKKNETDAAMALLEQAVAIAERQSARLWEARARIDIALLLANQQREAAARSQLDPIRHWDETINVPERSQAETVLARLGK